MWDKLWKFTLAYASKHADLLTTVARDVGQIVVLFIAARILISVLSRASRRVLQFRAVKIDERRRQTLLSLVHNIIRYTIYFIFVLMSLEILSFHIQTLLAGAGIAGLAVGFGAQSVIKDLLTGFFILFEDQYGVGDYVTINGQTGTITQIGIRLTRLQVWTGEVESIPNGLVQQVTNYSRTNSLAVVDVGVNYATDINQAMEIMNRTMQDMKATNPNIVGDINVLGVQALQADDILLRATADCKAMTQYGVQRMAYLKIKEAFDEAGIDIPVPQRVIEIKHSDIFPNRQMTVSQNKE
ncbi:mechanosensitive ion channel family protein [Alicyclobacillus ferrooxydans]|uniref:mechanosensitive ion channel family protein n=1 Tax=Alicyclobacillus ferrooxydans TaxID=471514 RepID=UPI0006D532F7|nr:mechanosensitive ion channel family protein [Alicyclobacillus ferrooxydans]